MPEIEGILIAVPTLVCIRVGEMAFAETVWRVIAGKGNTVRLDKPVLYGREYWNETKKGVGAFLIMEGEFPMFQSVIGHSVRNAGMLIGKNQGVLLSYAGSANIPDGTASESTYVCSPLVRLKSEQFPLTKGSYFSLLFSAMKNEAVQTGRFVNRYLKIS